MAKKGGSKQKKMNARVDFTPMVDMIMLLVTFFMLCTTLLKPQTMEIAMPTDNDDVKQENKSQVATDEAITIIIDKDNKIYYYEGKQSEAKLIETAYGKDGIRKVLLKKNIKAAQQAEALKKEMEGRYSSNPAVAEANLKEYKERIKKIKNADGTPTAIIKPSDHATYDNLISVLDEMQHCYIGRYVIDKVNVNDSIWAQEKQNITVNVTK